MPDNIIMIDPPEGSKYGFPIAVTKENFKKIKDFKAFCIAYGYPKEVADSYGDYFKVGIIGEI